MAPAGCPDPCLWAPQSLAFGCSPINHSPGQSWVREQGWGGHGPWGPQTEWLPMTPESPGQGLPGASRHVERVQYCTGPLGDPHLAGRAPLIVGPGVRGSSQHLPCGPQGWQPGGRTGWPSAAARSGRLTLRRGSLHTGSMGRTCRPGRSAVTSALRVFTPAL